MIGHHKGPLVSVVIPTFNRAWILNEAIDSVMAQTCQNYELIVVDDGSTDGTDALLEKNKGIVVIHQENKGVSAARNRGVAASKGDLIAFLDSDDLWLPEKLSAQVAFFLENKDAEICQTQELWIRNGKRINPKNRHLKESGNFFKRSLELCLVSPSAVMIKKRLFEKVGLFDETLPACEDYDMWLRVGATHPIFLIDQPLIVKRGGHTDQLSAAGGLDKYRIQSLNKIIESGILDSEQQSAAIEMLRKKAKLYASGCRKRGKLDEMVYYEKIMDQHLVAALSDIC
jgi:glycosyltransferase involved in cell wall biosynthesis